MTDFLSKMFVKNYTRVGDPEVRMAYGRMASIVGIICNLLFCGLKALIGVAAGSVSIVADAIHNLSDAIGNVVSLIGFKLASMPANTKHPYGHGRYEYIAGLVISVMVCAVGLELIQTGYERILAPDVVELSVELVVVLVVSTLAKLWMMSFMHTLSLRIDSEALEANAVDCRNDGLDTIFVLVFTIISVLTGIDFDGYVSLVMGVVVLVSGAKLVKETLDPLLGQAPSQAAVDAINQKILSYNGIKGTHSLMVHEYGPGRRYAMAHVEMDPSLSLLETHNIVDKIERDLYAEQGLKISLHPEPIMVEGPEIDELTSWLQQTAERIAKGLTVSNVRAVPNDAYMRVVFTLARPANCEYDDEWLDDAFEDALQEHFDGAKCTIAFKDA